MDTIKGDPAKLVAATLTQAEMALRGGRAAAVKPGPFRASARDETVAAYEFYLALVTTGAPPE